MSNDNISFKEKLIHYTGITPLELESAINSYGEYGFFTNYKNLNLDPLVKGRIELTLNYISDHKNLEIDLGITKIENKDTIGSYFRNRLRFEPKERGEFAFLDLSLKLIKTETLFYGTINEAPVYTREILEAALKNNAKNIIMAHNHPGGSLNPSSADLECANRIKRALKPFGIEVIDNIIVGNNNFSNYISNKNSDEYDISNNSDQQNIIKNQKENILNTKGINEIIERSGSSFLSFAEKICALEGINPSDMNNLLKKHNLIDIAQKFEKLDIPKELKDKFRNLNDFVSDFEYNVFPNAQKISLGSCIDAARYCRSYFDQNPKENVYTVNLLNSQNNLIQTLQLSSNLKNADEFSKEIAKKVFENNAKGIITSIHLPGNLAQLDIIEKNLKDNFQRIAHNLEQVRIHYMDNIYISGNEFFSFVGKYRDYIDINLRFKESVNKNTYNIDDSNINMKFSESIEKYIHNRYSKECPYIEKISFETAKNIYEFNKEKGAINSIQEIKKSYIDAGKKCEQDHSPENIKQLGKLGSIVEDLKQASMEHKREMAKESSKNLKLEIKKEFVL